jgi:hypothetical protein
VGLNGFAWSFGNRLAGVGLIIDPSAGPPSDQASRKCTIHMTIESVGFGLPDKIMVVFLCHVQ